MKLIRKIVYDEHPFVKASFLPTYYIYNIKKDLAFTNEFVTMIKKGRIVRPDLNRMERIFRYSHYFDLGQIQYCLDSSDIEIYNLFVGSKFTKGLSFPLIEKSKDEIRQLIVSGNRRKITKIELLFRDNKL